MMDTAHGLGGRGHTCVLLGRPGSPWLAHAARVGAGRPERDAVRTALGLAPHEVAIGTVGRLAWQKGIGDLLDAVPMVRARCPSARFFVAGGGRDAPAVAAAVAALDGSVTLL